jgi:hypothetical protein
VSIVSCVWSKLHLDRASAGAHAHPPPIGHRPRGAHPHGPEVPLIAVIPGSRMSTSASTYGEHCRELDAGLQRTGATPGQLALVSCRRGLALGNRAPGAKVPQRHSGMTCRAALHAAVTLCIVGTLL